MPSELEGAPVPYTRAIAHSGGWQWRIPLQHRAGNGLVYSSDSYSDDEALSVLQQQVSEKAVADPRLIRFTTGQRKQYWHRNCIAIGLSSGFIEPMESTSIHFIQNAIMWLLLMFPEQGIDDALVRGIQPKASQRSRAHPRLYCAALPPQCPARRAVLGLFKNHAHSRLISPAHGTV